MVTALTDLPEERATSFIAMSRLSPSTYAKERFTQPIVYTQPENRYSIIVTKYSAFLSNTITAKCLIKIRFGKL